VLPLSSDSGTDRIEFSPALPGRQVAYWSNPRELQIVFTSTSLSGDAAVEELRAATQDISQSSLLANDYESAFDSTSTSAADLSNLRLANYDGSLPASLVGRTAKLADAVSSYDFDSVQNIISPSDTTY